jgi:hypothetical protein
VFILPATICVVLPARLFGATEVHTSRRMRKSPAS